MLLGLLGAFGAAACYGTGSVLQAIGARRTPRSTGVDPRLLLRLAGSLPYLAGLLIDVVGFVLSIAALRSLPLFLVEAAVASSVAVTALLAARLLAVRPNRREALALGGIGIGLLLLAASAAEGSGRPLGTVGRLALLAGAPVLAGLAILAGRGTGPRVGVGLGAIAGLAFGGVGVAARVLVFPHPLVRLLLDPVLYALAAYGVLGTLLYATALQRGSVTTSTAALFAAETIAPALIGVLALGDSARPGFAGVAVAGFVVTVCAAVALARYGELPSEQPVPRLTGP
ncbi:MAG: hypothetical protein M3Z02_07140 [Actinomycetota bacterium]|nr:hypothetical protein [Actinomycetota bacterium]